MTEEWVLTPPSGFNSSLAVLGVGPQTQYWFNTLFGWQEDSYWQVSWRLFVPGAMLKLVYDLMQFINPMILGLVIEFVMDRNMPAWKGYVYAAAMFCVVQVRLNTGFHPQLLGNQLESKFNCIANS